VSEEVPTFQLDLDRLTAERRERSRGIQLGRLPGSTVRLSNFTKKQIARKVRLVPDKVRSGLRLRPAKRRVAWQTVRKQDREWQRKNYDTPRRRYWKYSRENAGDWEITKEEWGDIWDLLGTPRIALRRYDPSIPYTKYNLYIEELKTGRKLYEGVEELMRELGYIV
jgi:hypothetical protein